MVFRVFFKHMTASPALQTYAQQKIDERLSKYANASTEAHLTFAVEAGVYCVACHITGLGQLPVHVESRDASSMNAAIDDLADKLDGALRRAKEKLTSHRSRATIDQLVTATDHPDVDRDSSETLEEASFA